MLALLAFTQEYAYYTAGLLFCKNTRRSACEETKTIATDWKRKVVVGDGFEPSKSATADLQSAPFGRSGIPPNGAGEGNRTLTISLEG